MRGSTTFRPHSSHAAGNGELVVAVCAEYDALPAVGHACGHNIIAATAVGAGLALAAVADDLGLSVRVARDAGGGGRRRQGPDARTRRLRGVHAAMMVHPWPSERLTATCLAVAHYDVHFTAVRPTPRRTVEGVNVQDALTIAQVAIGLLRQQLPPGDQVHGVVAPASTPPTSSPPPSRLATWCGHGRQQDWPRCGRGSTPVSRPARWRPAVPSTTRSVTGVLPHGARP